MKGQWRGIFSGYSTGEITIEIDENSTGFSGRACTFEDGNGHFVSVVKFETAGKQNSFTSSEPIQYETFEFANIIAHGDIMQKFPKLTFPDRATIRLRMTQRGLRVRADTFLGSNHIGTISALLTKGAADKRSKIYATPGVKSWDRFKAMVGKLPTDRYIFRGQPVCNRLRTSFHRTDRRNLFKFIAHDIPNLHAVVSSQLNHYFDLRDTIQNAAFWNLLQHHGYPTPLLDWTHSPYVAAYFAFREKVRAAEPNRKVRIFKFDHAEWINDFRQFYSVVNVRSHFSILRPIALENPRALPQQAICSVTNVEDIEEYLQMCGSIKNKTYIEVFEIPYSERAEALSELRLMGVAAGSLFPV